MNRIHTNLGDLHVERYGAGPAVLCWPSLFCDGRTLRPMADELSRDHLVLQLDGPGHGKSGGVERRFTMEDCADAAMQVLDAVGVARAAWVGSAWGGHVGVVAALRHPGRLSGLVTMNAPMGAWEGSARRMNALLYWTWRLAGRGVLSKKVATVMIARALREQRPELLEPIIDCIRSSPRGPFLSAVRSAMLDRPSLVPRLPEVRVPTLFVTGSEDPVYPVELAREQANAIPGVRFEVVAGTSHLSAWEAPQAVVPLVRAFLSGLEARAARQPTATPA